MNEYFVFHFGERGKGNGIFIHCDRDKKKMLAHWRSSLPNVSVFDESKSVTIFCVFSRRVQKPASYSQIHFNVSSFNLLEFFLHCNFSLFSTVSDRFELWMLSISSRSFAFFSFWFCSWWKWRFLHLDDRGWASVLRIFAKTKRISFKYFYLALTERRYCFHSQMREHGERIMKQ